MSSEQYSKEWLEFSIAEANLIRKRMSYYSSNINSQIHDLALALKGNPNEVILALDVLKNSDLKYGSLMSSIMKLAIDGGEISSALARGVVGKYRNLKKNEITVFISDFISHTKEDYFNYSNTAQLLYELSYNVELAWFLESYCARSQDSDIQNLVADYN